jgi:predicted MFS family arabinose efflux permease
MADAPPAQAQGQAPPLAAPPKRRSIPARIAREMGLASLYSCAWDVKLLIAQRFVRLFAYGTSTLVLVAYLDTLGISKTQVGLFMTLTLVGDVGISFLLTLFADGIGRRFVLGLGALLMSVSGVVFATSGNYWVLLAAAVFGVISPRFVSSVSFSLLFCISPE